VFTKEKRCRKTSGIGIQFHTSFFFVLDDEGDV